MPKWAFGILLLCFSTSSGGVAAQTSAPPETLPSSLEGRAFFGSRGELKGYYCMGPCVEESPHCCIIFGPN